MKKILKIQEEEVRDTTWLADVRRIIKKNGIELDMEHSTKSAWKKEVKSKIQENMVNEMREECSSMEKARTIKDETFGMKVYMQEMSLDEVSDAVKMRLHMVRLPCNYGKGGKQCPLCEKEGKIRTEHYFEECHLLKRNAEIWGTSSSDMNGSVSEIRNAKNHLKQAELLVEPYMI